MLQNAEIEFAGENYTAICGEKKLALAVLADALNDFQKYAFSRDARGRTLFEDSAKWFNASKPNMPFSFEAVCDLYELDADYVRRGVKQWYQGARKAIITGSTLS